MPNLDIPVPGNYDTLGRSELAVYRPTTAQWFITSGTTGHITQLGQGGLFVPLTLSSRTSVVSQGSQTSRFGIAQAKQEAGRSAGLAVGHAAWVWKHRRSQRPG
jgi:hypothetical protein